MKKKSILVVCVHNSARSQMAEEYFKKFAGDFFTAESAGLSPGNLNPYVIRVLKEEGIDISNKETQNAFELYEQGKSYTYVITVCSQEAHEQCPVYPNTLHRYHWPFDDPSSFKGSDLEIIEKTRVVRNQIKAKVKEFVDKYRKSIPIGN